MAPFTRQGNTPAQIGSVVRIRRDRNGIGPGRRRAHSLEGDRLGQVTARQGESLALELQPVVHPLPAERQREAVADDPPAHRLVAVARAAVRPDDDGPRRLLLVALLEIELPGPQDRGFLRDPFRALPSDAAARIQPSLTCPPQKTQAVADHGADSHQGASALSPATTELLRSSPAREVKRLPPVGERPRRTRERGSATDRRTRARSRSGTSALGRSGTQSASSTLWCRRCSHSAAHVERWAACRGGHQ